MDPRRMKLVILVQHLNVPFWEKKGLAPPALWVGSLIWTLTLAGTWLWLTVPNFGTVSHSHARVSVLFVKLSGGSEKGYCLRTNT